MRQDIEDWIALSLLPGVGSRTVRALLAEWSTPGNVLQASVKELTAAGLTEPAIVAIQSGEAARQATTQCERLTALGMTALALNDELYPQLLKEIYDPPPVLYLQGDVAALNRQPAIAVVGSRRCSTYGRNATEMLASELATRGVTIISGLARGIDTAAHKAALTAKGKTVAVLGNGLDQVYPRENKDLAAEITNNGAVISELPLGAPPLPQNFPFRNRIISGLCLGVLIVEAAERSGSLITARMALEQGRDVFAVPGNITSGNSFGPNYLIKDGAKLVQSWRDIVEELPTHWKATLLVENSASLQPELPLFSAAEEQIYHLLDLDEPRHIDQLSGKSGLAIGEVLSTLLSLEIKDWVKQLPGKNFVRKI